MSDPTKMLLLYDENGIGNSSINWPWPDDLKQFYVDNNIKHIITDIAIPYTIWVDESTTPPTVNQRTYHQIVVNKTKALSNGSDLISVTGIPSDASLFVNGVLEKQGGPFNISKTTPGFYNLSLGKNYYTDNVTVEFVDLANAKQSAKNKIDLEAGEFRKQFITDVPGQQMTYQKKETEARLYVEAASPNALDYPFLNAEATALGISIETLANQVISNADQWAAIGAAIEGLRIGSKQSVDNSTTLEQIETASNVDWQSILV